MVGVQGKEKAWFRCLVQAAAAEILPVLGSKSLGGKTTEKLPWEKGRPAAEGHSEPRKPHTRRFHGNKCPDHFISSLKSSAKAPHWLTATAARGNRCLSTPSHFPPHPTDKKEGMRVCLEGHRSPQDQREGWEGSWRDNWETTATGGLDYLDWLFCLKKKKEGKKLKVWINLLKKIFMKR